MIVAMLAIKAYIEKSKKNQQIKAVLSVKERYLTSLLLVHQLTFGLR